jgi:hypothetical protein
MPCSFAGASVLALALSLCPVGAQTAGSWWPEAGFALKLPDGWRVEKDLPHRGLVLRPPGADAPEVDLVTWRVSVGVSGAEGAAAEHERLLAARMRYRRTGLEPINTTGAGEGVLVEGLASTPEAGEVGSVFAAFTRGRQAYVVGAFVGPDDLERARRDCVEPILERLALTSNGPATGTAPPREPRQATGPTLPVSPPVSPESPEPNRDDHPGTGAVTPAGPPGEPSTGPSGFSLRVPAGWRCETLNGVLRIASPASAYVFAQPVVCASGTPGQVDAEDLIARCVGTVADARVVTCSHEASSQEGAWVRTGVEAGDRQFDGAFSLSMRGQTGLLLGVLAPRGELDAAASAAAETIASFSAEVDVSATAAALERTVGWTDPTGLLGCNAPSGWTLPAGLKTYDGRPAISLEGWTSYGAAGWFEWRQPVRPIFRELTDAMRRLGFRDGDPYYAYDGVDPRMVLTRGSAGDLAARYLLPEGLAPRSGKLAVVSEAAAPGVSLIGRAGEETALVALAAEPGEGDARGWCLVSQAPLGEARDGRFWEAAALSFGGRPGRWAEAARALEQTIRSATVALAAAQGTRATLDPLLAQARGAVNSPAWRRLVGESPLTPAPTGGGGAGGERQRLTVPPALAAAWRALASGPPPSYNGGPRADGH